MGDVFEEYAKEHVEEYAKEYIEEYAKEYADKYTREVIVNMLKDSVSIEKISLYVKWPVEKINEIATQLQASHMQENKPFE